MRAFLFALAFFLTGFAATQSLSAVKPAAAGSEAPVPKKITPPIPASATRAQPGPVKARPTPAATPLVISPILSPLPVDTGDCRLGCAQAYYFCLSNDGADSCGTTWTGCRSDCARAANP
jgi:hypothetical protein